MPAKKVFIGWSGENKLIAEKISVLLANRGYVPIVGGEDDDASMFVGTTIIEQMNRAEMAIMLFERLPAEKGGGVSANVMFEWGYLLHKLPDSRHLRIYLLNMSSKDLPTDVTGCWSCLVDKPQADTPEAKDRIFNEIASEISESFLNYAESAHFARNRLDYLDDWDENKQAILHYDGSTRIAHKLIFGLQFCIYSGRYHVLHTKLKEIWEKCTGNEELRQVLNCAMSLLEVFISTRSLSKPMNEDQFIDLSTNLQCASFDRIVDPNLAAWCEIFREDKLELCYEFYSGSLEGVDQLDALMNALTQCDLVLELIDKQVARCPSDEHYAMLYRGFTHRNKHLVLRKLADLEGTDAYDADIRHHCRKALEYREALYQHYWQSRSRNTVTMDYITQEYLLGLAEQYHHEEDSTAKKKMLMTIRSIHRQVKERYELRGMIYDRIQAAVTGIPGIK